MTRTTSLLLALLAATAYGPVATASHLASYANNPLEHDDQGRSNEPDGARTAALGAPGGDCTVDVDGDGRCTAADLAAWPRGHVVARGCSDENGRQPSGLCGAEPVVCSRLDAPMCGPCWPGTVCIPEPPSCAWMPSGRGLRFLDVHVNLHLSTPQLAAGAGGVHYFEVNRKLEDTGLQPFAASFGLPAPGDAVLGPTGIWAWYGLFRDKNCNGVIDHDGDGGQPDPANEFTWVGNCRAFAGGPGVTGDVCRREPTIVLGWVFPGNHHAGSGAACISPIPAPRACLGVPDAPGTLAVCTVLGGTPQACDAAEQERVGDPLLGPQDDPGPDFRFDDRTGDPRLDTRMWVAGLGWAAHHYDQSVATSTLVAGAVNPAAAGAQFRDVDHHRALHPALDALVQGAVKPALRGAWLGLRG